MVSNEICSITHEAVVTQHSPQPTLNSVTSLPSSESRLTRMSPSIIKILTV